jgi:hypothetical protein
MTRIVELGIGDGARARRMIAAALRWHSPSEIHYSGIDLFEARPRCRPGMTLKQAHQFLCQTGVRLRLLPGDPYSALARQANTLGGTDLVVIASDVDLESLARAWFYLPRMLHPESLVLCEEPTQHGLQLVEATLEEVSARARAA